MDIKLGDKIEVSALELTMWLDGCICEALEEACEREIDTTVFAKLQVHEFFNRKKDNGTEVPCSDRKAEPESASDENNYVQMPTMPAWPWGIDYNGLPVLDSMELIVQYAAAVLHRHVAVHEVHWEPCDVDSVQLYVGCRWEDSFAEALSHMNGDMEALQRMKEVMRRKPVMLGRVNGVAADVLMRQQDGM